MHRRTDGWKMWHKEAGPPPKNSETLYFLSALKGPVQNDYMKVSFVKEKA